MHFYGGNGRFPHILCIFSVEPNLFWQIHAYLPCNLHVGSARPGVRSSWGAESMHFYGGTVLRGSRSMHFYERFESWFSKVCIFIAVTGFWFSKVCIFYGLTGDWDVESMHFYGGTGSWGVQSMHFYGVSGSWGGESMHFNGRTGIGAQIVSIFIVEPGSGRRLYRFA